MGCPVCSVPASPGSPASHEVRQQLEFHMENQGTPNKPLLLSEVEQSARVQEAAPVSGAEGSALVPVLLVVLVSVLTACSVLVIIVGGLPPPLHPPPLVSPLEPPRAALSPRGNIQIESVGRLSGMCTAFVIITPS